MKSSTCRTRRPDGRGTQRRVARHGSGGPPRTSPRTGQWTRSSTRSSAVGAGTAVRNRPPVDRGTRGRAGRSRRHRWRGRLGTRPMRPAPLGNRVGPSKRSEDGVQVRRLRDPSEVGGPPAQDGCPRPFLADEHIGNLATRQTQHQLCGPEGGILAPMQNICIQPLDVTTIARRRHRVGVGERGDRDERAGARSDHHGRGDENDGARLQPSRASAGPADSR